MLTAPLFPPALGFVLGVVVDARCAPAWYVPFALLLVVSSAVVSCRFRRRPALWMLFVCGLCVGALAHHWTVRTGSAHTIERFATDGGLIARVSGVVASPVRIKTADPGPLSIGAFRTQRTVFLLDVASVAGREGAVEIGGTIRVTVREALLDLVEHERIELTGRLYRLHPPSNPGAFDWQSHMRRQGVVATMVCPHRENVRRIEHEAGTSFDRAATRVRSTIRGWLVDDLVIGGDREAGLLAAMVLGHRSALDRKINDAFVRAGCAHFLAVSGVHVVIVIFVASIICRLLFLSRVQRLVVIMLVVLAYAIVAEPRPSIMRASVIAEIYFVGCLLYRERARLNWISATVLVLGAAAPAMVFDVGYQLSTTAVVGICFLPAAIRGTSRAVLQHVRARVVSRSNGGKTPASVAAMSQRPLRRGVRAAAHRLRRYVGEGLSISVAAWLATWPVVAAHFGQTHPYGPLATLVMMPMLTLLMGLGFAKLVVSSVMPAAGVPLAAVLDELDSLVVRVADALGGLPGATVAGAPPSWWVIASYYALLTTWCWYVGRRSNEIETPAPNTREPQEQEQQQDQEQEPEGDTEATFGGAPEPASPWARRVFAVSALMFVVSAATWCVGRAAPGRLVVTVLDVGAGTAIVLELPEGETVLCDAGTLGPVDVGRHIVVPFLRHRGIRRLDRIYISHANLDHFNGLPSVLAAYACSSILVNERFDEERTGASSVDRLHELVEAAGGVIRVMDPDVRRWEFGGVAFEMLWPPTDRELPLRNNDASTVLRVTYRGHAILLPGDIEHVPQSALLEEGGIAADVLVLPHHGSVRSSSQAFFEAVGADVLIRSANERTADTFNGLTQITEPATVWNTADVGAVSVVIDEDGVHTCGYRRH